MFLTSADASFVTGIGLFVDGGTAQIYPVSSVGALARYTRHGRSSVTNVPDANGIDN